MILPAAPWTCHAPSHFLTFVFAVPSAWRHPPEEGREAMKKDCFAAVQVSLLPPPPPPSAWGAPKRAGSENLDSLELESPVTTLLFWKWGPWPERRKDWARVSQPVEGNILTIGRLGMSPGGPFQCPCRSHLPAGGWRQVASEGLWLLPSAPGRRGQGSWA